MSTNISRPSSKAEIQEMVEKIKAPSPSASGARLDGAVDQAGSAEEGRNDRRRRRLSRQLARLFVADASADRRLRQPEKRGLYEYRHQIAKIGKPMDRGEWWMPPQLVNAVNLPVQNALNFPAAILAGRSSIRRPTRRSTMARSAA
jgi:hypothetical protein